MQPPLNSSKTIILLLFLAFLFGCAEKTKEKVKVVNPNRADDEVQFWRDQLDAVYANKEAELEEFFSQLERTTDLLDEQETNEAPDLEELLTGETMSWKPESGHEEFLLEDVRKLMFFKGNWGNEALELEPAGKWPSVLLWNALNKRMETGQWPAWNKAEEFEEMKNFMVDGVPAGYLLVKGPLFGGFGNKNNTLLAGGTIYQRFYLVDPAKNELIGHVAIKIEFSEALFGEILPENPEEMDLELKGFVQANFSNLTREILE